jgi:hypothetical protein
MALIESAMASWMVRNWHEADHLLLNINFVGSSGTGVGAHAN